VPSSGGHPVFVEETVQAIASSDLAEVYVAKQTRGSFRRRRRPLAEGTVRTV
jgi:hypothetical protein